MLRRSQAGDSQALEALLRRHQKRLYNVCLRMVSHRDDAAEATQEAMLKIVEHIGSFRGDAAVSTWMIRIAMNASVSCLRRRRVRQTASLDGPRTYGNPEHHLDQATALREELADGREPSPSHRVEQEEMREQLAAAIAALEEDFRAVLVLRDIDQMTYEDMAKALELPIGTVKSRLFRARLMLRQRMLDTTEASASRVQGEVHDG